MLDPRGWGRWAGVTHIVKKNLSIPIITVYRPSQVPTAMAQHGVSSSGKYIARRIPRATLFISIPIEQFLNDLADDISRIHLKCTAVVVAVKFNL